MGSGWKGDKYQYSNKKLRTYVTLFNLLFHLACLCAFYFNGQKSEMPPSIMPGSLACLSVAGLSVACLSMGRLNVAYLHVASLNTACVNVAVFVWHI